MSITETVRLQVRQRANFACEFCGVSETDTGGELTIDHFRPQTKGGTDDLDNLLSKFLQGLQQSYTQYLNRTHHTVAKIVQT